MKYLLAEYLLGLVIIHAAVILTAVCFEIIFNKKGFITSVKEIFNDEEYTKTMFYIILMAICGLTIIYLFKIAGTIVK